MRNIYNCNFPNLGFVGTTLSAEEMQPILDEVAEIQADFSKAKSMQTQLIGQLKHEYAIVKNRAYLEKTAQLLIDGFAQSFNYKTKPIEEYKLDEPWVNFQRKHEFNPTHSHSGSFSFVLWVKIPYTMEEEEQATSYVLKDRNCAGSFVFQYIDTLGCITPWAIPADKTYEGKMILFPSALNHSVNPFYSSDEFRISISGNLSPKGGPGVERVGFI